MNYNQLYSLQDKVLKIVFENDKEFYLTGGTCINRFYWEQRYSDDLDFFIDKFLNFKLKIKYLIDKLSCFDIKIEVNSKDFVRVFINNILQIDFVNEFAPYYKEMM